LLTLAKQNHKTP